MADDWDLYAVVRSCFNAAATSTASSSTTTDAAIAPVENSSLPSGETSLSSSFLASPSFQSGHTSSDFPGFANHTRDSFRGLEEIYKEPYEDTVQSFVDLNSQAQHIQAIQGPGCTADQTPQQQRIYGQPQQLMQQPQRYSHLSREMFVGASLSFPSTSPQPERPRRRKNQQAKRIQQMTQEELSADSWAWRKYGQKPIKDSPYPRNYYRCSTSKGCTARKQVERCPADPSMYVVSYSGEHSHPRPTHRSSLAGTTRSKVPPAAAAAARPPTTTTATTTSTTNIHNIASSSMASCSSSSPASASSFSPTATPITEGDSGVDENVDQETADNENNNSYGAELLLSGEEEVEGWADDGDDDDENDGDGNGDDDILIPNYALVNDDRFFKGLHFKD